jgi:uncharacterized protein YbjT (DUF2867 family)
MEFRAVLAALLAAVLAACSTAGSGPATVLVVGGGQSGAPLARILTERGYAVRVMVRDPARATGLPAGVEIVQGDATRPASLPAGFAGADYVISTIGAACVANQPFPPGAGPADIDYLGVANLADAARAAGAKQFVLISALGAGDTNPKNRLNELCGMAIDYKGRGEARVRDAGVPYTIVRPGGLKPFPRQPPCVEGQEPLLLYARDVDRGPGIVCRADVALVAIDALGNPNAVGKTVNLVVDKQLPLDAWRQAWAALPAD